MPIATATRAEEFWQQFGGRARVADGAIGTILCSRGVLIDGCFDDLNIVTPDMLRQIHQEYVKAGAGDLKSDPFGANRMRLAAFGLAEKPRSGA
jgi:methionine synthase / methylenetetrahydrofolate reductase(NADPH)